MKGNELEIYASEQLICCHITIPILINDFLHNYSRRFWIALQLFNQPTVGVAPINWVFNENVYKNGKEREWGKVKQLTPWCRNLQGEVLPDWLVVGLELQEAWRPLDPY
jgi:hypothetical protein